MIISNVNYPINVIAIGGEFMTVLLVISLFISVLAPYTKYWDKYRSGILDACIYPLILILTEIVIFKMVLAYYY